jgi:hypothetical protein
MSQLAVRLGLRQEFGGAGDRQPRQATATSTRAHPRRRRRTASRTA